MTSKAFTLGAIGLLATFALQWAPGARAEDEQMAPPEVTKGAAPGGGAKATAIKGNKKETKINFEDEAVEGELKKPELFYMFQKKQFNFKRLIKLRDDFLPEMRRDADDVRRSRSK